MQVQNRSVKPEIRSDKHVNRSDTIEKPAEKTAKHPDKPVRVVEKSVNLSDKLVTCSDKAETTSEKVLSGSVHSRRRCRKTGGAFLICQKQILRAETADRRTVFSGNRVGDEGKITGFIIRKLKKGFLFLYFNTHFP